MRPGFGVTVALLRRVAWTAAGTTGLSMVSQGLADHVLAGLPVVKHVAGAIPGTGVVSVRQLRLANVAAEACSPVARSAGLALPIIATPCIVPWAPAIIARPVVEAARSIVASSNVPGPTVIAGWGVVLHALHQTVRRTDSRRRG